MLHSHRTPRSRPSQRLLALAFCWWGSAGTAAAAELASAESLPGAATPLTGQARGRAWAAIGVSSEDTATAAWSVFGLGLLLTEALEVEAVLPIGYGWVEPAPPSTGPASRPLPEADGKLWVGNPYLGVNAWVVREPALRLRLGGGVTIPLARWDAYSATAERLQYQSMGSQDPQLWLPRHFSLVGRARVESSSDDIVLSADLALIAAISLDEPERFPSAGVFYRLSSYSRETELFVQPVLGAAGFATPSTLIGARLPVVWATLAGSASFAFVPFVRQDLGDWFMGAELAFGGTDPLFGESDTTWGLQVSVGTQY